MSKNNQPPPLTNAEDAKAVRERVKYEDKLLLSRTSIILTLNGLIAVASGIKMPYEAMLLMIVVLIIANSLWLHFAIDARKYIDGLTNLLREASIKGIKIPIDERIRYEIQKTKDAKHRIGPTFILAILLPTALLTAWIVILLLTIAQK